MRPVCQIDFTESRSASDWYQLTGAYRLQQLFRRAQSLGGWPGPEPAAAQRWSSTIGCPAWQPRPSCIAVLRTDVSMWHVLLVERFVLAILKWILLTLWLQADTARAQQLLGWPTVAYNESGNYSQPNISALHGTAWALPQHTCKRRIVTAIYCDRVTSLDATFRQKHAFLNRLISSSRLRPR